jgi:hypothetical protein
MTGRYTSFKDTNNIYFEPPINFFLLKGKDENAVMVNSYCLKLLTTIA